MKLAIVGSRGYPDLQQVVRFVLQLPRSTVIVSGGAKGVDSCAESTARRAGMKTIVKHPDVALYGNFVAAAQARNQQIVDEVAKLVAFISPCPRHGGTAGSMRDRVARAIEAGCHRAGGWSHGTMDSIKRAKKKNIPITVYDEEGSHVTGYENLR